MNDRDLMEDVLLVVRVQLTFIYTEQLSHQH